MPNASLPTGTIEFIASHQPSLLDGDYVLAVSQQVQIDGTNQWTTAPSSTLQFSVAGPRFSLDPGLIAAQFPPPKSAGEYFNVLPHVIFTRTTIAWERTVDGSAAAQNTNPVPWLALLLFDATADAAGSATPVPTVSTVTVQDLLTTYGQSATPNGQPEFVQVLAQGTGGALQPGQIELEVSQQLGDRLTVIDVPKQLLWQILPDVKALPMLAHVRSGQAPDDPNQPVDYPVVFCNRLPAPGTGGGSVVGTQSTVHLVSLEARKPLLDELTAQPKDDGLVRLVSLASWSFSTLQEDRTFVDWVREAWCPDASRTDVDGKPSVCASGIIHTLQLPPSGSPPADQFLAQGYVPLRHQTRQGNRLVSWYRGPLLPGPAPTAALTLPVRSSDELVRYHANIGMFDTSYAAAWELGRSLTLRSKVGVSLFNWKRANAQQLKLAEAAVTHLPFAPDAGSPPAFPADVTAWFGELQTLQHVPFAYLVPLEAALPAGSLRFFTVDGTWLECLLDGAFSIGRVTSADATQDGTNQGTALPATPTYSGFLLRSPVVAGWPTLGVEAYDQAIPPNEAESYLPTAAPLTCVRMDRLAPDTLLCLFEGAIQAVDIHEHPDVIHFGVDMDDPNDVTTYFKQLHNPDGTQGGKLIKPLPWLRNSNAKRTIDIGALANQAGARDSAAFGVMMIEGVEKVRFLR